MFVVDRPGINLWTKCDHNGELAGRIVAVSERANELGLPFAAIASENARLFVVLKLRNEE